MALRLTFVLLFSVSVFGLGLAVPAVMPIPIRPCGLNEEFSVCAGSCQPTCANPNPRFCPSIRCMPGCVCKPGFLKNANGDCAPAASCMGVIPAQQCGANEEFRACGSACTPDCANPIPKPFCTLQCVPGCFCKEGHLRDHTGTCVQAHMCAADSKVVVGPGPVIPQEIKKVEMKCAANEEFLSCGSACVPDCANPIPKPFCTRQCVIGCFCKEGHLRDHTGSCVQAHQCRVNPTVVVAPGPVMPTADMMMPKCAANEEYQSCGSACVPDCANPIPKTFCTKQCVPGCFCKEGHLRDHTGTCVHARQCRVLPTAVVAPGPVIPTADMMMPKCAANEEFLSCGSACVPDCANPIPKAFCTKQCVIGCFCKEGHLRDHTGSCVQAHQCRVVPTGDAASFMPTNINGIHFGPGPVIPQHPTLQDVHFGPGPVIQPKCGENEEYLQCKRCEASCAVPEPICPLICTSGCSCKTGFVRENGQCLPAVMCAKPEAIISPRFPPRCAANEEFQSCGSACAPTCENPNPSPLCNRRCVIGCFCKEGLVRHASGMCMPSHQCNA